MGLDEVTQICPVPLPSWLSDSGGKGIQVVAVVHGEAQLAERWGEHGRQVVLDTSSVKVFLPGITDVTTLQAASTLCGQASWKIRGQDHATRHDVATPDMIRQLPAGFALVIRGGCAPVIARLPRAWRNPAYRRARRQTPAPAGPARPSASFIPDPVPAGLIPGDGTGLPTRLSRPESLPTIQPSGTDTPASRPPPCSSRAATGAALHKLADRAADRLAAVVPRVQSHPGTARIAQIGNPLAVLGVLVVTRHQLEGELMSAESSLTAVAVVTALLNEDIEGLAVLLPDGLPEPGRELVASLASLAVLSAKVAARAEGITEGEYLDRIVQLWTDTPR